MRKVLLLLCSLVAYLGANSQSYHFSQFYSTPLLNNPALTGYTDGPYRIATNFRSQWQMGGSPYTTASLSADFSPLRNHLAEGNRLGIGISLLTDQSLNGALQTNSISLSTAYNLTLDYDGAHHLGLGLQGSYHQRRIDFTKLTFENQYLTGGFSQNIPVAESYSQNAKAYIDLNTGLLYNYSSDGKSFFASLGAYNLLQHRENIQVDEFKMPVRYSFNGGGQLDVGYAGTLYYSLNHLKQGTASSTTLGGAYGLQISEEKKQEFDLGLWYRFNDAIIPYLGYQLKTVQVGLSYDYTTSKDKTSSQIRNAFELSFVYLAEDKTELKRLVPWY
jgi:type IX secretion system PorP/SprF family membrane protein